MYIDIDECDDSRDINLQLYIRNVVFVNLNKFEEYTVNKVQIQKFSLKREILL
jgi:hypothetical protein